MPRRVSLDLTRGAGIVASILEAPVTIAECDTTAFAPLEGDLFPEERRAIRNAVGIRRRGFSPAVRREIKRAYHIVFHSKLRLEVALDQIREEGLASDEVARLVHFLETSERGFSRP